MAWKRHGGRGDHRRQQDSTRPHDRLLQRLPKDQVNPAGSRDVPVDSFPGVGLDRTPSSEWPYLEVELLELEEPEVPDVLAPSPEQPFSLYSGSVGFIFAHSAALARLVFAVSLLPDIEPSALDVLDDVSVAELPE